MNQMNDPKHPKGSVLVVDDHPILRHGVAELLNREPDLACTGEADSAEQALMLLEADHFDLAVIDVSLPGVSGVELVKTMKLRHPEVAALVISMHDETLYAERALRAGARGYLMKQEATRQIVTALRRIRTGQLYMSERLQARLLERVIDQPDPARSGSALETLSDRELEVLRLIGRGLKAGEIAQRLNRSVNTVDAHRANIKRKLKLRTGAELTRVAIRSFEASP